MNPTHFVINGDDILAIIYASEKFGKVVVFKHDDIDINFPLGIVSTDGDEQENIDLLEMITKVLSE